MNLYISTTFINDGYSLYDALKICDENKISSIEIGSNHLCEDDYSYISDFNMNFLIHNYFPVPKNSLVINIASLNAEIRKKSINQIKRSIKFCSDIGASLYTFHAGFISDPLGANKSKSNYDFQWDESQILNSKYEKATDLMYNSLDKIINYASSLKIPICVETQGSFGKKEHLLFQKPEEFDQFMDRYEPSDIGLNLNIGHLYLSANAFNYNWKDLVDSISRYVLAMELSHNDGFEDQHLPLISEGWYWDLINDLRFKNIYKILEFRNTSIKDIINNIELIREKEFEYQNS